MAAITPPNNVAPVPSNVSTRVAPKKGDAARVVTDGDPEIAQAMLNAQAILAMQGSLIGNNVNADVKSSEFKQAKDLANNITGDITDKA
jgi:hypothetical protein